MYLAEVRVRNFRCLEDLCFKFLPGLNVILGENNSGKSALIDALRLVLGLGQARREIFFSDQDFHHDHEGNITEDWSEIHATFRGLSPDEQGGLVSCLVEPFDQGIAQVHLRYELRRDSALRKVRVNAWGGTHRGDGLDFHDLEGILAVYLEPLRDPQMGLQPGRNSRIARLLRILSSGEQQETELKDKVLNANKEIEQHELVRSAKKELDRRLRGITGEIYSQTAELRLTEPTFNKIAQSLRALFGNEATFFETSENGLGFNNLLYIAAVLGELEQAKLRRSEEVDLAALLIEEPEAHLHPQLQTALVGYLESVCDKGLESDEASMTQTRQPVQVFVTTHSPTVAARVDLDSLNILHLSQDNKPMCFAVREAPLKSDEKKKLRRFLDVTKAQLFFAKAVILVEGISEALLLPVFARMLHLDLEHHRVCVVNVQSTAFDSFAKLFWDRGLSLPAAIVSDSDPPAPDYPNSFDAAKLSDRARNITGLQKGSVKVFFAVKTFEYDLALAGNGRFMANVYQQMRPRKGANMVHAISATGDNRQKAQHFFENFDQEADKATFAQAMAESLSQTEEEFHIPQYLQNAIKFVTRRADANPL